MQRTAVMRCSIGMMVPERLTSAAGAIGTARAALELAVRYSSMRKAFGKLIREFQG